MAEKFDRPDDRPDRHDRRLEGDRSEEQPDDAAEASDEAGSPPSGAERAYGRGLDVEGFTSEPPEPGDTARLEAAVARYGPRDLDRVLPLINPHRGEATAYDMNCGSAARAFVDTYQEREVRVASGLHEEGERLRVMTDWMALTPRLESTYDEDRYLSHEEYTDAQWAKIAQQAEGLPDGTVLTIGVQWNIDNQNAGGHWFNAVKVDGKLKWIDAQHNLQHDWPPGYAADVESVFAAQRAGAGTQWKELDLRD